MTVESDCVEAIELIKKKVSALGRMNADEKPDKFPNQEGR
jgi:hypothetical protein